MQTVNMHEAKTHLSKLVEKAVQGEPFIIARAGKPLVRVVAISEPEPKPIQRIGALAGQITVPEADAFYSMDREIEAMFFGEDE